MPAHWISRSADYSALRASRARRKRQFCRLSRLTFSSQALLERRHYVDNFTFFALRLFHLHHIFVTRALLRDQFQELLSFHVLKFFERQRPRRVPRDQALEFFHRSRGHALLFGQANFFRRTQLIRKAHRLSTKNSILRKDRDQVLFAAHNERGDPSEFALLHRLDQQPVSFL